MKQFDQFLHQIFPHRDITWQERFVFFMLFISLFIGMLAAIL